MASGSALTLHETADFSRISETLRSQGTRNINTACTAAFGGTLDSAGTSVIDNDSIFPDRAGFKSGRHGMPDNATGVIARRSGWLGKRDF